MSSLFIEGVNGKTAEVYNFSFICLFFYILLLNCLFLAYALVFHVVNIALHVFFFFCWFVLCFLEKQAKIADAPICHCHKACWDINGKNEQGDASQTKYRKYYKSGSTSDIRHFDHATGWEMAHNSQCRPFSCPN